MPGMTKATSRTSVSSTFDDEDMSRADLPQGPSPQPRRDSQGNVPILLKNK